MRSISKWAGTLVGVMLLGSAVIAADDSAPPKKHERAVRLTKPWSEISSLTDDEKTKILAIHGKANEEIKAIHEKEHDDIMAVLTADQKKEAESLEEKGKGHHPTTKPGEEKPE